MEKVCICILLMFGQASARLPHFPSSIANSSTITEYTQDWIGHKNNMDRIVGGVIAKEAEIPYQASIQRYISKNKAFHFCGGSIVSPKVIVSAGHCAKGQNIEQVRICVGSLRTGHPHCTLREIQEIIIHPNYDSDQIDNDISCFILKEALNFSDAVSHVSLPTTETDKDNTMCVVSGWGTTSEGGSVSDELRYVEVPTVSDEYCKECYGESEITSNMICAGVENGGKDSCQGDSGGPMVIKHNKILTGIVSWGYGCARPGYPGVYSKVSSFTSWIQGIIDIHS